METTLIVMAAGMGSRFGGLKQAVSVTDTGLGILDFSAFDAKKAGFDKIVFIIREDMAEDFKNLIGNRISTKIKTEYVIQDTSILPEGRTKPFGTGHAVLCCKDKVNGPFAVINADDYYGANAFTEIGKHLQNAKEGDYAMTAFILEKTLSDNGTVSRGACEVENGYLKKVTEITKIASDCSYVEADGSKAFLDKKTPVSMNLWGMTPGFFDILDKLFKEFLENANLMKDEFFLPSAVTYALNNGLATVKVFENTDKWLGITYREDLEDVKKSIADLMQKGIYDGI